jgi:hypothetical protein
MSEMKKTDADGSRGGASKDLNLSDMAPVLEALRGLRYGSVEIFIQDYRLMQIDRREKIRSFKP